MRNLKNIAASALMIAVLMFGTTFAHGGIIIAGAKGKSTVTKSTTNANSSPCRGTNPNATYSGIIIAGLSGIIIAGIAGIIIAGLAEQPEPQLNCGIIIAG